VTPLLARPRRTAPARTSAAPAAPVLLTDTGRQALQNKADTLRTTVLPELLAGLAERDRDRRVDADYHRVRDEIAALEVLLSTAGNTRSRPPGDGIGVGDRVCVELAAGEHLEVLVACEQEAAIDELRISEHSPLARALAGAVAGNTVTVLSPAGAYPARVLSVDRE